jgi:DNA polymerase-3 subunit gamma/tau
LERLVASWTQIRRDVKTANARIAALLASTDPTVVRDTEIVLVSPYEFHRNKLNEDGARRVIEDVIARYMGRTYQMICVDASDSRSQARPSVVLTIEQPDPMTNGHHDEPAEPATPSADSDEDPRIRAAKSIFDATEVDSEG